MSHGPDASFTHGPSIDPSGWVASYCGLDCCGEPTMIGGVVSATGSSAGFDVEVTYGVPPHWRRNLTCRLVLGTDQNIGTGLLYRHAGDAAGRGHSRRIALRGSR